MRKLLGTIALALWASVASGQDITNHAIPVGTGPGAVGWRQAVPGVAGTLLVSNGVNADPSFQTVTIPINCASLPALTGDVTTSAGSCATAYTNLVPVAKGGTNLSSGTSGGILGFTAIGTIASSGLLTANALVFGGGAGVLPSTGVGLGTTTTVLHGNASGLPSWAAVSLTADISGILGISHGGTNCSAASGTCLDNITGFSSSGYVNRTGAGTYSFDTAATILANICSTQGNILYYSASAWTCLAVGTTGQVLSTNGAAANPSWVTVSGTGTVTSVAQGANTTANPGTGVLLSTNPCIATCTVTLDASYHRGYWSGCQTSAPGGALVLTITACVTDSDDFTTLMKTTSTFTKAVGTAWAVGSTNGCLDTGSIATSTWYHVFQVIRTDTGVVDFLCSLSPSAPTLPTGYTKQRRIGSYKTDGTPFITGFTQVFDEFLWLVPVQDISVTNPGTSAVTRTLGSQPTGVVVQAIISVADVTGTTNHFVLLSPLAITDSVPSISIFSYSAQIGASTVTAGGQFRVWTNTSAAIRSRASASGGSDSFTIISLGWHDSLGR